MLEYIYLGLIINFICIIVVTLLSVFQVFTSTPKELLAEIENIKETDGTFFYNIIPYYSLFYIIILIKNSFYGLSFIQIMIKTDSETNIFKIRSKRWVL